MFGEDHKAPNYSFLNPSVTSALGPNNLHSTHFHNTLRVCSAGVGDIPHKTIIFMYLLILMFLDRRQGYLSGLDSAGFDLSVTRICVRLHAVLLWLTNSTLFNDIFKKLFCSRKYSSVKVKFTLQQAMKAQTGGRILALLFL